MKLILELMKKYRSLISYGIFGVLSTIVNIGTYYLCYDVNGMSNVLSNILAWIAAVLFAFVTNKLWVFESKSLAPKVVLYEFTTFMGCRGATGAMDLAIMYVCVDILLMPALVMKVLSNILVIILNYVFSKLIIFKKK